MDSWQQKANRVYIEDIFTQQTINEIDGKRWQKSENLWKINQTSKNKIKTGQEQFTYKKKKTCEAVWRQAEEKEMKLTQAVWTKKQKVKKKKASVWADKNENQLITKTAKNNKNKKLN